MRCLSRKLPYCYFFIILICFSAYSQYEILNEYTVINDANGNRLSLQEFDQLMDSDNWSLKTYLKESAEIDYIQLVKKTEEDKVHEALIKPKKRSSLTQNAPDFSVIDIHNNTHSLHDLKGSIVYLTFIQFNKKNYATLLEIDRLYEKYTKTDNKVQFMVITPSDTSTINSFLKLHPVKLPIVSQPKKLLKDYEISQFPTNILINHKGEFLEYRKSSLSTEAPAYMDAAITKALRKII